MGWADLVWHAQALLRRWGLSIERFEFMKVSVLVMNLVDSMLRLPVRTSKWSSKHATTSVILTRPAHEVEILTSERSRTLAWGACTPGNLPPQYDPECGRRKKGKTRIKVDKGILIS